MKKLDWLLVLTCSIVFIAVCVNARKSHAHNPDTHQSDALSDAKSDAYGMCCSGDDYVRISTWESTGSGYRIMYKGEWIEGSRSVKVNNMENPDGEAKAWIYYAEGTPYLRCFMAGARS